MSTPRKRSTTPCQVAANSRRERLESDGRADAATESARAGERSASVSVRHRSSRHVVWKSVAAGVVRIGLEGGTIEIGRHERGQSDGRRRRRERWRFRRRGGPQQLSGETGDRSDRADGRMGTHGVTRPVPNCSAPGKNRSTAACRRIDFGKNYRPAAKSLKQDYHVAYVQHAPMEPRAPWPSGKRTSSRFGPPRKIRFA